VGRQRPWEVDDELWELIEPLLPQGAAVPERGGRPRVEDRRALQGILFVLHTGIQWEFLPQELGFGSGMTCWRRLRDWHEAGVWEQLQQVLLDKLRGANQLDFSRAIVDASHVRAMRGGPKRGRVRSTAPDRARSTT
jgi:transposase